MDNSKEIEKAEDIIRNELPYDEMTTAEQEALLCAIMNFAESQTKHLQEINKDLRKQVKQWERVPGLKELKEENEVLSNKVEKMEKEREYLEEIVHSYIHKSKLSADRLFTDWEKLLTNNPLNKEE